jgi:hypothetical protein
MYYVGIDYHKRYSMVSAVDEQEVLVREARLANTPQAVRKRAVGMDRLRQTVQDRGGAESASCKQWAGLEWQ